MRMACSKRSLKLRAAIAADEAMVNSSRSEQMSCLVLVELMQAEYSLSGRGWIYINICADYICCSRS